MIHIHIPIIVLHVITCNTRVSLYTYICFYTFFCIT